jgi:hypothetical protein
VIDIDVIPVVLIDVDEPIVVDSRPVDVDRALIAVVDVRVVDIRPIRTQSGPIRVNGTIWIEWPVRSSAPIAGTVRYVRSIWKAITAALAGSFRPIWKAIAAALARLGWERGNSEVAAAGSIAATADVSTRAGTNDSSAAGAGESDCSLTGTNDAGTVGGPCAGKSARRSAA